MKRSNETVQLRRNNLINLMKKLRVSDVKQLSQELQVSEMTIRRDCAILHEMGQIQISFGKIEMPETEINNFDVDASDSLENIKQLIAQKAAQYISNRETIFINTSSTALKTLLFLKDKNINVMTNDTKVISMEHHPQSAIILTGGEVRYPKGTLSGDIAIESFSHVRSDITILGCSGINIETGISTSVIHEARINRKMIENSGKLIVVADYRKIGKSSNFTIGEISDIDLLITDSYADEKVLAEIEKTGVQVIQVTC